MLNIIFYCLCSSFFVSYFSCLWKVNDSYNKNIVYDAAIILSGVIEPGNLEPMGDTDYNFRVAASSNRLIAGIAFVKSGHAKSILFGNWVKNHNEGLVISKFAKFQGLKEEEIKMYGDVTRTIDAANGVKIFLDKRKYKNVILITSEMHMRRALAIFKKAGILPSSYSVDKHTYGISWNGFIPTVNGVRKVKGFLSELFAYVGYYLKRDI